MGPDSFQWCPVTGQGAMGTNWGTGSSIWTWGRTSSVWGWRSTGTGCPGRLWSLLLWRYSRPAWTRSCAAYCRWPCFGRGGGLDDPQRALPTPTILWFCDSVLLYSLQQRLFFIVSAVNSPAPAWLYSEPGRQGQKIKTAMNCADVACFLSRHFTLSAMSAQLYRWLNKNAEKLNCFIKIRAAAILGIDPRSKNLTTLS